MGVDAAPGLGTLTEDALLAGRVKLLQPAKGYRASTDAVLLAAAVPATPGEGVLELGTGAGAALLCLAARVPRLKLCGLEREPTWVALAARNGALNGVALELHAGTVEAPPKSLKAQGFDHVLANPPFFAGGATMSSADPLRDRAHRGDVPMATWVATGLARLRPGGWLTLIQRTERLSEVLGALDGAAGDVRILPLAGREGRDAGRVLIRARKGSRAPLRLASPLVLHSGPSHFADGDDFTPEARAVLRDGAALTL